jgi:hypothetical protein
MFQLVSVGKPGLHRHQERFDTTVEIARLTPRIGITSTLPRLYALPCTAPTPSLKTEPSCRVAERNRQSEYQSAFKQYSDLLKPGTPRRQVESYLKESGRGFEQMCRIGQDEMLGQIS